MVAVLEKNRSVTLHNISWNSYKTITDALQDETPAHFTYDNGNLEIMVLSLKHEHLKKLLATLFERLTEELDIEIFAAGSTTFQREDLDRGFEPDECYYIENAEIMRGKESVDLSSDPPPDLTIEIDIKHSSLNRMDIFASIGVKEVWRYDGKVISFHTLIGSDYLEVNESSIIEHLSSERLLEIVEIGKSNSRKEFLSEIRMYAKELGEKG